MNRAPPAALERVVRRLIPPAAREEVAGDLWERYRSPGRYLREAAATLPFVILSQIRRATSVPMVGLEAFILFASLGGFQPADLTPGDVLASQRAILPTLAGLAALLLRDAYRTTNRWTSARALCDILAVTLAVFTFQALVAMLAAKAVVSPFWRLPPLWLYGGLVFSLLMLFVLRTGVDLVAPDPAFVAPHVSAGAIERDYLVFQANVRFKNRVENGTLALLVALAVRFDLVARPVVAAIGFTWIALTLALIAHNLTRGRPRPLPPGGGFVDLLSFYRAELARQRRAIRFVWWWYFVPLFAGLCTNLLIPGIRDHRPFLAVAGLASVALLAGAIAQVNRARRSQLEEKMAALDTLMPAGG